MPQITLVCLLGLCAVLHAGGYRARAGLSDQSDQDDRAGRARRADRCAGAARRRPHGGGARAARHHRQSRRRGRRDRRQGGGSSRPRRLHAAVRQHRDARQYPRDLEKRRLRFGQELRRRRQGDGLLPGPRRQPQPSGEVGRGAHRLCQGQPGQAQLRRRRTDQPHQSRGRALQAQGRARFRGRAFQERRGIADLRRRRSVPAHHRQRHRRARADGGRQAAPAGGHQRPPAKRLP